MVEDVVMNIGLIEGQNDKRCVAYWNIAVVAPSAIQNSCLEQSGFPHYDLLRNSIYPEAHGTTVTEGFEEGKPGNGLAVDRIRSGSSWSCTKRSQRVVLSRK